MRALASGPWRCWFVGICALWARWESRSPAQVAGDLWPSVHSDLVGRYPRAPPLDASLRLRWDHPSPHPLAAPGLPARQTDAPQLQMVAGLTEGAVSVAAKPRSLSQPSKLFGYQPWRCHLRGASKAALYQRRLPPPRYWGARESRWLGESRAINKNSFEKASAQTDSLLLTPEPVDVSGGRGWGVSVCARGVAHMCLARWSGTSMRLSKCTHRTGSSMGRALS